MGLDNINANKIMQKMKQSTGRSKVWDKKCLLQIQTEIFLYDKVGQRMSTPG